MGTAVPREQPLADGIPSLQWQRPGEAGVPSLPVSPCFEGTLCLSPHTGTPSFFDWGPGAGIQNHLPLSHPPPPSYSCMPRCPSTGCIGMICHSLPWEEDMGTWNSSPGLLGSDQPDSAECLAATFPLDLILGSGLIHILWVLGTIWKGWPSPSLKVRQQKQIWGPSGQDLGCVGFPPYALGSMAFNPLTLRLGILGCGLNLGERVTFAPEVEMLGSQNTGQSRGWGVGWYMVSAYCPGICHLLDTAGASRYEAEEGRLA